MTRGLLHAQLSWWMLLLLAIGLLVVGEVGYWIGRRQHGERIDEQKAQTSVHVGALLGLLGLLLAFSFEIVEARFSARKALVLEEANAIGTTYLRAQMLPGSTGERIGALLRDYVNARVGPRTPDELERAIQRSETIHTELWKEAITIAQSNPDSEVVSIFVQSLNQMIDLHESRITVAIHQRLPGTILAVLCTVAALSIAVQGYGAGLSRARAVLPTTALVLAIMSVVTMIVDLDNPSSKLFRVNQSAMHDLKNTMSADYHRGARQP